MPTNKKTKIVATLGPACSTKEVIKNIEVYGEMHRYIPVIARWAGFTKITEKEVLHRERKYGTCCLDS